MGRWPATWPERVHLIGVGGVAMSGLAALLRQGGAQVSGSDRAVYPPASTMLAAAGIEVHSPFDACHLDPPADLVVVGNAISRGNPELEAALQRGLPIVSLPEVVERLLTPARRVSVVAGTHGKTTTSSILAWLHHAAGREPSFLIGGQPGNFALGAQLGRGIDLVLEGDEYDSAFFDKGPKFLHYWPQIAILGPVEFDHADIYADLDAVRRAFALLLRLLPADGKLIVHDHPESLALAQRAPCPTVVCGDSQAATVGWVDRHDDERGQRFTLRVDGRELAEVRFALGGEHNARNGLAALAAAQAAGIDWERGAELLAGYRGPARRLQRLHAADGITLYDDFAHHPTAIDETLRTLRGQVAPGGRLVACVEPRSNTMVRPLFAAALERALRRADVVLLAPIDRPERFAPGEALDVAGLVRTLRGGSIDAHGPLHADQIADRVVEQARSGDTIVVMSNGSFDGLTARLVTRLAERSA